MYKSIFFLLLFSLSLSTYSKESVRVLAMECEVRVPTDYAIDTRVNGNNGNVRFFLTGNGVGTIYIGPTSNDISTELVKTKERSHKHLQVTDYEYKAMPQLKVTKIVSFNRQIQLVGDATNLKDDFVRDCLRTTDQDKVKVLYRELDGCASEVNVRHDFPNLYDGVKYGVRKDYRDGKHTISGLVVGEIKSGHHLSELGVKTNDLVSGMCGVPFGEILKSGDSVCCTDKTTESIKLSIVRDGQKAFDVEFKKSP